MSNRRREVTGKRLLPALRGGSRGSPHSAARVQISGRAADWREEQVGAGRRRKLEEAEQIAAPEAAPLPRCCLSGLGICAEREGERGDKDESARLELAD